MSQMTSDMSDCYQSFIVNSQVLSNDTVSCPTPLIETQNIFAAGSNTDQSGSANGQMRNFKFKTENP